MFDRLVLSRRVKGADWKERVEAARDLGNINDPCAAKLLVKALEDDQYRVCEEAKRSLVKLGPIAVAPLIERLRDKTPQHNVTGVEHHLARTEAAKTLKEIGDRASLETMIEFLKDGEPRLRGFAATVLGGIGDSRAVEPLIQLLKCEQDYLAQLSILRSLGELEDERAVDSLMPFVKHHDQTLRGFAAGAVARIREKHGISALQGSDACDHFRQSDTEIVELLSRLCTAYTASDKITMRSLEPEAKRVGALLNERGGIEEMRRVFRLLKEMPGTWYLQQHWGGVGEWKGWSEHNEDYLRRYD